MVPGEASLSTSTLTNPASANTVTVARNTGCSKEVERKSRVEFNSLKDPFEIGYVFVPQFKILSHVDHLV